jgi:hypothetical protein
MKEFINNIWWNLLNFIFGTKLGHIIFIVIFVMIIVGLLSLVFKFIDTEIFVGTVLGSLITGTYLAYKDDSLKWW